MATNDRKAILLRKMERRAQLERQRKQVSKVREYARVRKLQTHKQPDLTSANMATDDRKVILLRNLQALVQMERERKQVFKVRAYDRVRKQIEALPGPVRSMEDLGGVTGMGESIRAKVAELFEADALQQTEATMETLDATSTFMEIMGIGPVKARELVEKHGVRTLEDLRARADELLNDKQKMGLKYVEAFRQRIPRAEMLKHEAFLKKAIQGVDPGLTFEVVGSFRRGAASSGDIDVLITHRDASVDMAARFEAVRRALQQASSRPYIVDVFGQGDSKLLGVCKLPRHRTFRRIDLMVTPPDQYPFALLYFTGSQQFNIDMRARALEKGVSLSQHGFKHAAGAQKGEWVKGDSNHVFETEQDVFAFLDMPYVPPTQRGG
jgi:DNA polymerase/3'-5' exonuclease PolX